MHDYLLVFFNQNIFCSSHARGGKHHRHSLIALRNLYTHANNWNIETFPLLIGIHTRWDHFTILFSPTSFCIYSLNRECVSYRKPGQTGKEIQPSYNRTQEPFQSWSTNITSDSRMLLWIQDTRKWFSPGKLSLNNWLSRKCFILMESLVILFPV